MSFLEFFLSVLIAMCVGAISMTAILIQIGKVTDKALDKAWSEIT